MKPLVSICIPTYNRVEQLKITMESIMAQPEFREGKVEIVISDNASDDDTEQMGRQYAGQSDHIVYFRNEQNVRDRNFPLALSRGTGILRKLNNDTLCLNKDTLRLLCNLAEEYQESRPCIFLSNGQGKGQSREHFSFRDFVVTEGHYVTWIGGFTIWEDDCAALEKDTAGCELSLWQVRKIYETAYRKNDIVVCNQRIGRSLSPAKKDVSYGLYQVFYVNYMKLLEPYEQNQALSAEDMEIIQKNLLINFFTEWMINWELSMTDAQYSATENLKELVSKQSREKPYWKEYQKLYRRRYHFMKMVNKLMEIKNFICRK